MKKGDNKLPFQEEESTELKEQEEVAEEEEANAE